ncbi:MAG: hypothetical protein KBT03_10235 [Bacteroidales bacterium]|nr:hypothetical protein [Candidatus Scybalousia scybalohippi]
MKSIILQVISFLIFTLLLLGLCLQVRNLRRDHDRILSNLEATQIENDGLKVEKRKFIMTTIELKNSKDSLLKMMKKMANDNRIKDRKIQALYYDLENFSKVDTLILRDTIFKSPDFVLDTLITDEWNSSRLHLKYPGEIAIKNQFKNEKFIVLHSKKEPIKERKWFLPRWFTRKHIVVEVLIEDKNPYIENQHTRYVEIIKK